MTKLQGYFILHALWLILSQVVGNVAFEVICILMSFAWMHAAYPLLWDKDQ